MIDALEAGHPEFDLDVLLEIFGEEILYPESPIIGLFKDLYTVVDDDQALYWLIARTERTLQDGCYGFGARPRYNTYSVGVLFTEKPTVAFEDAVVTISGRGYSHEQLDDDRHQQTFVLAKNDSQSWKPSLRFDFVKASESRFQMYNTFDD